MSITVKHNEKNVELITQRRLQKTDRKRNFFMTFSPFANCKQTLISLAKVLHQSESKNFSQYSGSTFLYSIQIESWRPVDHVTVCLFQKVLHYDG